METKTLSLDEVKPYWKNPRQNDRAADAVAASIEKYGYNVPIVVDSEYVIVAGHARYKALRKLGRDEAVCVVADLTPDQAREYRIADNKTSEFADWDLELLESEIKSLPDLDSLSAFFSEGELKSLLDADFSISVSDVSADEITKTAEAMGTAFEGKAEAMEADLLEVICPECHKAFMVNRADILNRPEKLEDH